MDVLIFEIFSNASYLCHLNPLIHQTLPTSSGLVAMREREREKMLETFFIFRENSSKLFLKNNVYFSKNRLFGFTRVILMAHIISSSVPGVQS